MSLWYLSGSKKQPEPPRPQIKIGQPERVGLLRLRVLVYSPGLTWGSIKSSDKVVEWGSLGLNSEFPGSRAAGLQWDGSGNTMHRMSSGGSASEPF
jgi:hypothetical protein